MKKNKLLFALFFLSLLASCGKSPSGVEFSVNDTSTQTIDPDVKVLYSQIKSEILFPHCISCHDVGTEAKLKAWITPGKPDSSPFFTSVENGSMPKNQRALDTRALELIQIYIKQMAPVVVTPIPIPIPIPIPTPAPTGNGISYAEIKSSVLTPFRCLNCHSVGTEAKLAKWMNKTSPASSKFYTTMKSGSMPQGGPRADAATLGMVLQYIKDFANR